MRAVNLLPEARRASTRSAVRAQERATNSVLVITAVALVLIAMLSAVAVVNGRTAASDKRGRLAYLDQQLAAVQASTRTAEATEAQVKVRLDAVTQASSPGKRMRWDQLLEAISRALPKGAWLSTLKAQSPTPVVVDPTKTVAPLAPGTPVPLPTAFVIGGYVTSNATLPLILQRLSLLPMLSDIWLQQSVRVVVGTKSLIQFTIAANVEGGSS